MTAPPSYVFTIFAFASFFLCLIRFLMQWHAWNVGVHLFLAWVGLSCLALGINSIIWNQNTVNWAPVWCDISSRLIFGPNFAVPAVILSINRRLYFLASPTSLLHSEASKRREIMIDLAIGLGLPIVAIALSLFVQKGRFEIVEDLGCHSSVSNTWVALVIINIPPILLELIAGVYGCLSIHAFYKRRSQMNELLSNHESLNSTRYIRLMCYSICDLLTGLPATVAILYFQISPGLLPFPGLKQEYSQFSQVIQVPAVLWRVNATSEFSWEFKRWIMVWSAFAFFGVFGLNAESRVAYRAALQTVVQVFVVKTGIKGCLISSKDHQDLTFKAATRELSVSVDPVHSDVESSVVWTNSR